MPTPADMVSSLASGALLIGIVQTPVVKAFGCIPPSALGWAQAAGCATLATWGGAGPERWTAKMDWGYFEAVLSRLRGVEGVESHESEGILATVSSPTRLCTALISSPKV